MSKQKKTGGSKGVGHRYLFTSESEIEAIALAQLCQSNRRIANLTGFRDGQVTYLLGKAKRLEGYENFHTYRSEWRDGSGKLVGQVINSVLPQLKDKAGERLPKLITHPAPKISEAGND